MQSDKPMKVGDVANSFVRNLLDTAALMGADRQLLLDKNNISAAALEEGNRRLGLTHFMRLGYSAIKLLNEPAFGLYMGVNSNISRLGYAGFAAMTAPTLGAALTCTTRYEALTSRCYRGQSYMERNQNHFKIVFYSIAPYNEYTYFVVDAILSGWKSMVEWLTGRTDLVKEIQIEFPTPFYVEKYQSLLNCPVSFSQEENCVILKPEAFDQPVIYQNPIMHRLMLEHCEDSLRKISRQESFTARVQQILGPLLHGRTPSIEETAEQLHLPTWTLRRKLKDEGCSFQDLVDSMRKDLALGYIRDTGLSFGEISYILGFSTPGAFQRAFKRWVGTTPGDYRRALNLAE